MAKKSIITFNNPLDETGIDHIEVWSSTDNVTFTQLGADIAYVAGAADYVVEDASPQVVDDATLYYQARTYSADGSFSLITEQITISSAATQLISAVVENAAPNDIVLTFTGTVTATTPELDWTYSVDGGADTAVTAIISDSVLTLTTPSPIVFADLVSVSFANTTSDMAIGGVQLATITDSVVTNNVGSTPLVINTQPTNQTAVDPAPAVYTIAATGQGIVTYQWKLDGVNVTDGSGGTTDTYTTEATIVGQTGSYTCEVVDEVNAPVLSNSASLTVTSSINLVSASVEDADTFDIVLTFDAAVTATTPAQGHTYTIDGGASQTPTAAIGGNALTLTTIAPVAFGEVIAWSYDDTGDMAIGGAQLLAVIDQGILNNVIDLSKPVLADTFNIPNTAAGESFNYDVSAIQTSGGAPTSWSLGGKVPQGATIDNAGLITGTAVSEVIGHDLISVSATNAAGTSTVYSNDGLVVTGSNLIDFVSVLDFDTSEIVITGTGVFTATTPAQGHTYKIDGGAPQTPTAAIDGNVLTLTTIAPVIYGEVVTWSYDNTGDMAVGGVQLEAFTDSFVVNTVMYVDPDPLVSMPVQVHYPDFLGYSGAQVTTITPVINMYSTSGVAPCAVHCTAESTTVTGGITKTGDAINIAAHLEYRWEFLDSNGDRLENFTNNGQGTQNPNTLEFVDDYSEQVGVYAAFPIFNEAPEIYTVILTVRAPDGSGGYVTESTTSTYTVESHDVGYTHRFIDDITGNDANSGADAWGLTYSNATYDSGTGRVTAVGAFTLANFNPIADTVCPSYRDNWLFIDGKSRKVERIDDDTVEVALEDRAGISATGLSSTSANGPIKTIDAKTPDLVAEWLHLNGNGGASAYMLTVDRYGQNHNDINITGYNGDPADNGRVRYYPDTSVHAPLNLFYIRMRAQGFFGNLFGDGKYYVQDILHITGGNDSPSEYLLDNVYGAKVKGYGAGIHIKNDILDTKIKDAAAVFSCKSYNKRDPVYKPTLWDGFGGAMSKQGWYFIRGLDLVSDTTRGLLGHYIYPGVYSSRNAWTCIHAHGNTEASPYKPSFFMNFTPHLLVAEGDLEFYHTADNRAEGCGYYSDCSDVNNNNGGAEDAFCKTMVHTRSYSTSSDGFTYFGGARNNTITNMVWKPEAGGLSGKHLSVSTSGITNTYLENNQVNGGRGVVFHASNYLGDKTIESFNNEISNISGEAPNLLDIQTGLMDDSHWFEDNYYDPLETSTIYDRTSGTTVTVPAFDSLVTTSGGHAVNTANAPDWQDEANLNYLPVGFESSAPTINTNPEATASVILGEYLVLSADFDQATSHQWQKGGVDIVGANSPVLTYKVLAGDNGVAFTCIGTNAANSTTTTACTLTAITPAVPQLTGPFDLPDMTAGAHFNYDASALVTGGDAIDSWEFTGTPPTGAVISDIGVITGLSTAETLAGNSYGIKAINAGGDSNILLDADGIDIVAGDLKVTFNGVDGYTEYASSYSSPTLKLTFTAAMHSLSGVHNNNFCGSDIGSNGINKMSVGIDTSGNWIFDNSNFTVKVDGVLQTNGNPHGLVLGQEYDYIIEGTGAVSVYHTHLGSLSTSYGYSNVTIYNVTVDKNGTIDTYAMNTLRTSGDIETSTGGTGKTMTYYNVSIYDWA